MARKIRMHYTNGEVTVVWQPHLCTHSTACLNGLPQVFDLGRRPWVTIDGASTQAIRDQVARCPSGALTAVMNAKAPDAPAAATEVKVEVVANGPLLVYGYLTIRGADGAQTQKRQVTAFCHCGHSKNRPFCDGSHVTAGFIG